MTAWAGPRRRARYRAAPWPRKPTMSDTSFVPIAAPPGRGLYCNRTLNLRAIRAIGFDMDYTLVHYDVDAWEERAYAYLQQKLLERGWPVDGLAFIPQYATRGLVVDTTLGNIVKADRFGYVKRAMHGTRRLDFDDQRKTYGRTLVDLSDTRWVFLNTFFSLSEAVMYAQLVERLDGGRFAAVLNYADIWHQIRQSLDLAHAEGRLKAEVSTQPDRYVVLDPDLPLALRDLKQSGKRLLLITNSEWTFTQVMMQHAFDRFLPAGTTWHDLFELVIVGARKPDFFTARPPLYEVADAEGLLRPCVAGPTGRGVYAGGHADMIEHYLGLSGSEILYVGDHLYTDVRVSKDIRRWRTALIVRELEDEIAQLQQARFQQETLDRLMAEKAVLEAEQAQCRLMLQRLEQGYDPAPALPREVFDSRLARLRGRVEKLEDGIAPLAAALSVVSNAQWGPLMYAGNDRSHLASQVERYADAYTSRVSNFVYATPFAFLRSPRGRLPHDL
jgi:HAD superfamily 5'-nucleotidase-like hydrolase